MQTLEQQIRAKQQEIRRMAAERQIQIHGERDVVLKYMAKIVEQRRVSAVIYEFPQVGVRSIA